MVLCSTSAQLRYRVRHLHLDVHVWSALSDRARRSVSCLVTVVEQRRRAHVLTTHDLQSAVGIAHRLTELHLRL